MIKNTDISERIEKMLLYLNINRNNFAQNIGYERSQTLYDIISGKSKPSYDFFLKFLNSEYSELIDINWLITGNGNMIKENKINSSILNTGTIKGNNNISNTGNIDSIVSEAQGQYSNTASLLEENTRLKKIIEEKEALLRLKEEIIKSKEEIIELLKEKLGKK